jgi:hypothetical protein
MGCKRLTVLPATITLACLCGMVLPIVLLILLQRPALAQVESKEYRATRVDLTVPGGSAFVIKPNHSEAANGRPWIWYAPTLVKGKTQMAAYPNRSLTWLATRLLDRHARLHGLTGRSQGYKLLKAKRRRGGRVA